MNNFFFTFCIFICLRSITSISHEAPSPLIKLTDNTFDSIITPNSPTRWIIIFHVKTCIYCSNTIQLIESEIVPEFINDKSTLFASVECNENVWLAARFNITKIPYTILIENNKLFEYKSIDSKERFINFIKREKIIEESKPIPEAITNYNMIIRIASTIFEHVNEVMQGHLDKRSITFIKWNYYMTGGLFLLLFIGLVTVQSLVFKCICGFGSKKKLISKETHSKKD